ncbi:hypothetical protein [Lactococcus lactis]|jgi:hypothetical protein|uniref:hypothetical protein n=2 Tax=Lactococcus lactis TaxID=1358 RepID=UPI000ABE213A|nr:hypothetical protein [Lactococcus lactis]MDG4974090.1 hypothetical protein [Lactococcus lactis]MDO6176967.1 hypothetical protein [Lactococcus lactis]MDU0410899.1 hypothetical protein [Lactococcus lactis]WOF39468.1 hypothetical protein N4R43_07420 [Lactococcus lactis]BDH83636.1 hypothetical protein LLID5_09210 [Lactococcus lactis]
MHYIRRALALNRKSKMRRKKVTYFLIALILIIIVGIIFKSKAVNNSSDYKITNTAELEKVLKSHRNNLGGLTLTIDNPSSIVFPQKVYKVTEGNLVINLVGSSGADIDFNNSTFYIGITGNFLIRMISGGESSNYETIKNASFYGSASNTEEGKGRFGLNALKAHNVHFEHLSFYDAQSMGYHLFDLAAVDNFIFNDLEVRGFGKAGLSSLDRDRLYKSNPHALYSEAIQVDSAYEGCFGTYGFSDSTNIIFNKEKKGLPKNADSKAKISTNITLKNSYFGPYTGVIGQGKIDNERYMARQYFSATAIGSHSGTGTPKVTIMDNTFENTIYSELTTTDSRLYPIHFRNPKLDFIYQSKNNFINQHGNSKKNGYLLNSRYVAWYKN